jgi:hypothetical protein
MNDHVAKVALLPTSVFNYTRVHIINMQTLVLLLLAAPAVLAQNGGGLNGMPGTGGAGGGVGGGVGGGPNPYGGAPGGPGGPGGPNPYGGAPGGPGGPGGPDPYGGAPGAPGAPGGANGQGPPAGMFPPNMPVSHSTQSHLDVRSQKLAGTTIIHHVRPIEIDELWSIHPSRPKILLCCLSHGNRCARVRSSANGQSNWAAKRIHISILVPGATN